MKEQAWHAWFPDRNDGGSTTRAAGDGRKKKMTSIDDKG
jgi:hypothetical protein